jgi:hypothetical protein
MRLFRRLPRRLAHFGVFAGLSVGSACGGSTLVTPVDDGIVDASTTFDASVSTDDASVDVLDAGAPRLDAGSPGLRVGDAGDAGMLNSTPPQDAAADACTSSTQSDPLNCGICGHDCQGAACVAGVCSAAPRVLASGQAPSYLAVDAENVYWINALPQPTGASGHSQVMRCAIGGCNNKPTVLWDGLYPIVGIAVEQGAVWWPTGPGAINAEYGEAPNIMSCAVGGCSDAPTHSQPSQGAFYAFAANATNWFAVNNSGVVSTCPFTGCGTSSVTVFTDEYEIRSMALNATGVYWSDDTGNILSCPLAGCGDAGAAVAGQSGFPAELLAADGSHLYWLAAGSAVGGGKIGPIEQWFDGGVYESPLPGGGDAGSTALATYASWLAGAAIAVDGTNVYWSTEDGSGSYGEIVRCSIGGCGGSPTPLAGTSSKSPSAGLAVDATNVYWSDPGRGAVMVAPK